MCSPVVLCVQNGHPYIHFYQNNLPQYFCRSVFIIYKNVKYSLGKRAAGDNEDIPLKVDHTKPKWNSSQLAVGNWFSQTNYYKIKNIVGNQKVVVNTTKDL